MNNTPSSDAIRPDKTNYTLSLASEALRCGRISEELYHKRIGQIFELLAALIYAYTGGLSTSVENRTAARLMRSLLYVMDLALLSLSPEEAIERLAAASPARIYADGIPIERQYQLKARALLREARRCRPVTLCLSYNKLLDKTLPDILHGWDTRFDAGRRLAGIDYPQPTVNPAIGGILGVIHRLEELIAENRFLLCFDEANRARLEERFHRELAHPAGVRCNLGQLCFDHALLSLLAGEKQAQIPLSHENAIRLGRSGIDEAAIPGALAVLGSGMPPRYRQKLYEAGRSPILAASKGGCDAMLRFAGLIPDKKHPPRP